MALRSPGLSAEYPTCHTVYITFRTPWRSGCMANMKALICCSFVRPHIEYCMNKYDYINIQLYLQMFRCMPILKMGNISYLTVIQCIIHSVSVCPLMHCSSYNGLWGWGNPQGKYWQQASVFDVISLVTRFPQQGLMASKIQGKLMKEYIIHASPQLAMLMYLHQTTPLCGTNQ